MGRIINNKLLKDEMKIAEERSHFRVKCIECGHTLYIPPRKDKVLCNYCGNYHFKDDKARFEYRLREELNRRK